MAAATTGSDNVANATNAPLPSIQNPMDVDGAPRQQAQNPPARQYPVPFPNFPDRVHGQFMNDSILSSLVTPVEDRLLLFCHNVEIGRHIDMNQGFWATLLYNGQSALVSVNDGTKIWKPLGTTNEMNIAFEMYGIAMLESWQASQALSNSAVMTLIKNAVNSITKATMADMVAADWDALKAHLETTSQNQLTQQYVYSGILTVIFSICRCGNPAEGVKRKLIDEFAIIKNVNVSISDEVVKQYWAKMAQYYNCTNITKIMASLQAHFTGRSIRLNNLVIFAKNRNLTQYYAVKQALNQCKDFPWHILYHLHREECDNYEKARQHVRDRPYFGYGDLGIAAAGNYKNLAYVGVQLCRLKLGMSTLAQFQTNVRDQIDRNRWDRLINEYIRSDEDALSQLDMQPAKLLAKRFLQRMDRPIHEDPNHDNDPDNNDHLDNDESSSDEDDDGGDDGDDRGADGLTVGHIPIDSVEFVAPRGRAPDASGSSKFRDRSTHDKDGEREALSQELAEEESPRQPLTKQVATPPPPSSKKKVLVVNQPTSAQAVIDRPYRSAVYNNVPEGLAYEYNNAMSGDNKYKFIIQPIQGEFDFIGRVPTMTFMNLDDLEEPSEEIQTYMIENRVPMKPNMKNVPFAKASVSGTRCIIPASVCQSKLVMKDQITSTKVVLFKGMLFHPYDLFDIRLFGRLSSGAVSTAGIVLQAYLTKEEKSLCTPPLQVSKKA